MEQQFQQEVMMLATLKHPNIVRFIGACRKPMVWCIITEYAKGGSVRQFLTRRQNHSVPLKLAVKQALDVARGMEYVHGLNLIHGDLKSDNLLIAADKSIKIADFGIARIEVQTEGMTPETGTYIWMAPKISCRHPLYWNMTLEQKEISSRLQKQSLKNSNNSLEKTFQVGRGSNYIISLAPPSSMHFEAPE